jgi:hypothetical protein
MLNIKKIDKLVGTYIGKWEIMEIEICDNTQHYINEEHYSIRLTRRDGNNAGAAIQIERKDGELGYNVSVCYEEYDNIISRAAWGKNRLKDKDTFFASMQGILDSHYDKNKK